MPTSQTNFNKSVTYVQHYKIVSLRNHPDRQSLPVSEPDSQMMTDSSAQNFCRVTTFMASANSVVKYLVGCNPITDTRLSVRLFFCLSVLIKGHLLDSDTLWIGDFFFFILNSSWIGKRIIQVLFLLSKNKQGPIQHIPMAYPIVFRYLSYSVMLADHFRHVCSCLLIWKFSPKLGSFNA